MKNNNYPNWLVPLEIARKLKEIGMHNSEILVCNNGDYGWYRNEEMYDYDNDGDFIEYTALEVSKWEKSYLEPTYTWEQVFEWFREKGFESYIRLESHAHFDEGNYYYFEITKSNLRQLDWQGDFDDYNEAREALVKELIRTYKNEQL